MLEASCTPRVLGQAQLVPTFLKRGVWIEERKTRGRRQRQEASSEYCNRSPEFITHSPYIAQSKGVGADFHDVKNKQV